MRIKKLAAWAVVVFLLTLLSGSVTAADSSGKESWGVIELDNKPVGYSCDQFFKVAGGYRYISDNTLKFRLSEGGVSNIVQHIEMYVDQKYQAKFLKMITENDGVKTQATSDFQDKQVKTVIISADGKETQSITPLDRPVYFSSTFTDYLINSGQLKVGKTYQGSIWDLDNFNVADITVNVEKKTIYKYKNLSVPVYSLKIKTGQEVTELVDAAGETYWAFDAGLKLTARKVEKNEIPELQSLSADALIAPGNIQVAVPYRSMESKIKVTWKDLKFTDFNWDDNRQKLVEHKENPGNHEVTLAVRKDERDFTGKVSLPVTDGSMASFLAETQYITPSLPGIRKLVPEITGSETDGWIVTQKLVNWVYEYIKPELVPEALTTEQILNRKSGKSVEYAVLFTALARAAGLPARLALGERYQDNIWVGHMWNEVWLGEWVSIDVSHNQVAPDALLLKFVHSDTLAGTQKVRVGLIGQLGIEIKDLKLPDDTPEALKGLQTGILDGIYTNVEYRCQITAPGEWQLTETKDQGNPVLVMQSEAVPNVTGVLLLFNAPGGIAPEQVLDARIPALKNALPEFTLLAQETSTVGSDEAAVGTWTFSEEGAKVRQQNWIVIRGDLGYLFVFVAPDENWVENEGIFQQIRDLFKVFE